MDAAEIRGARTPCASALRIALLGSRLPMRSPTATIRMPHRTSQRRLSEIVAGRAGMTSRRSAVSTILSLHKHLTIGRVFHLCQRFPAKRWQADTEPAITRLLAMRAAYSTVGKVENLLSQPLLKRNRPRSCNVRQVLRAAPTAHAAPAPGFANTRIGNTFGVTSQLRHHIRAAIEFRRPCRDPAVPAMHPQAMILRCTGDCEGNFR